MYNKINKKLKEMYPYSLIIELEIEMQEDDQYLFDHFEENLQALRDRKISNCVSDKEFKLLDYYYKQNMTLEEVGQLEGVTRERIRQIIFRAIWKLKRYKDIFIYGYENYLLKESVEDLKRQLLKQQIDLREQLHKKEYNESTLIDSIPDKNIEELNFSVRSYNALKRNQINTLKDLSMLSLYDIEHIKNIGKKCVLEIRDKMKELGLELC